MSNAASSIDGSGTSFPIAAAAFTEILEGRATPAQIAKYASDARVWKTMEPYVSALTSDG